MQSQNFNLSILARALFGGMLMGLANLVPGISGGTMLLAVGIYTAFITSIADISTLKFRRNTILLLGTVVLAAVLAILLGAGLIKDLVVSHRWIMYSLFIGLTLGGAPLVWHLAKPVNRSFWIGAVVGFLVMVLMALGLGGNQGGESSFFMLFLSGLAGAASMILPGISGGYLLLLLGQYETILGAVDTVKEGLKSMDLGLIMEAMHVVIPVGLGVLIGIVGVSNLLKWLLRQHQTPTLGTLFGLLLGAVIGLWPFQQGVAPKLGDLYRGTPLTAETLAQLKPEKWPVEMFTPSLGQCLAALVLVVIGYLITQGIERMGKTSD